MFLNNLHTTYKHLILSSAPFSLFLTSSLSLAWISSTRMYKYACAHAHRGPPVLKLCTTLRRKSKVFSSCLPPTCFSEVLFMVLKSTGMPVFSSSVFYLKSCILCIILYFFDLQVFKILNPKDSKSYFPHLIFFKLLWALRYHIISLWVWASLSYLYHIWLDRRAFQMKFSCHQSSYSPIQLHTKAKLLW